MVSSLLSQPYLQGIMLIVLVVFLSVIAFVTSTHEDSIDFPWCIPPSNVMYKTQSVKVGDTLSFTWNETSQGHHHVSIYSDATYNTRNKTFIGGSPGTDYTFTDNDVGDIVFFCNIGSHCDRGQIVTFKVIVEGEEEEVKYSLIEENPCYIPSLDTTSDGSALVQRTPPSLIIVLASLLALFL